MSRSGSCENGWSPGTQVVALYNFRGTSSDDLPFSRGDILVIVQGTRDPNWYQARNCEGKSGMMPANYVQQMENVMPSWMHGKITREQAEELLIPRADGLFLVRESTSFPGDYTLSVSCQGTVEHYRIQSKNGLLTIDEEVSFETLGQLIQHYQEDADGLCTQLQRPADKGDKGTSSQHEIFRRSNWNIQLADIRIGDRIGKGEFGEVCKGELNGLQVAVKIWRDKASAEQFLSEAAVMTSLKHPNLVRMLGVVLPDNTDMMYLVTEYMARGSLVDYLRTRGRAIITATDQINFACNACCGMSYLEEKKIVHRDLAARNVLVHESGEAKVSDFGLAQRSQTFNQSGGKFPIKWTAPEALRDSAAFTSKSDMWSFGILLWEIYSFGRVPYPRIQLVDVVMHVERGYRMESPEGCPKEIYDIMQLSWDRDPTKRPSFDTVRQKLEELKLTLPRQT